MTDIEEPHDEGRPEEGRREEGRREELIAAALAGDLSPVESAEFDRLRSADPSIDRELASFGAVLDDVRAVGRWEEAAPTEALRARVLGSPVAGAPGAGTPGAGTPVARIGERRSRRAVLAATAAACLAIGAVGGLALGALGASGAPGDRPVEGPVEGPPGTLGAVEAVAFDEDSDRIELDGSVVAHTWGTETILRGSGFAEGESYELILVTESGERLPSGSFLGSAVEIDCEMNAAVLREAVSAIEITDATGASVATATLPRV